MPAPFLASTYMVVDPANYVSTRPAADNPPWLETAFKTAYNSASPAIPESCEGDTGFVQSIATIAYRYKSGTGVYAPTLTTISPTTFLRNSSFTITCTGTNIEPSCVAVVNNVEIPTTSTASTQVVGVVPASAIPTAGTVLVKLRNRNGTADSGTQNLTVT
jgi:IPT/TIG domain-containing protein